jgi:hypothetical protein
MPPPSSAVLPERVLWLSVAEPKMLKMPPPTAAELPQTAEALTVRVPRS